MSVRAGVFLIVLTAIPFIFACSESGSQPEPERATTPREALVGANAACENNDSECRGWFIDAYMNSPVEFVLCRPTSSVTSHRWYTEPREGRNAGDGCPRRGTTAEGVVIGECPSGLFGFGTPVDLDTGQPIYDRVAVQ